MKLLIDTHVFLWLRNAPDANTHQDDIYQKFSNQTELGTGNKLDLLNDELLENIHKIQLQQGLKKSKDLDNKAKNFTVEMETGTSKTYVYLRSVFENNQ